MGDLTSKKCVPCEAGTPPLPEDAVKKLLPQVPSWQKEGSKIKKEFNFKNFRQAMEFVSKVADLAEKEGHHPNICVFYSRVALTLWTHAIGGLSENDFILAAKIDKLL